jgi:ABC-type antimicrobial peptide transport system permease subunit
MNWINGRKSIALHSVLPPPLAGSNRRSSFNFENQTEDAPFEANIKYADAEFFRTYDLSFVAGRLYTPADTAREFVVNETFLKRLGITNPEEGLGKTITMNGATLPIVGVLKDFHLLSLQEEIEPLIMMTNKSQYRYMSLKFEGAHPKQLMEEIGTLYRATFPGTIYEYRFFDENVAQHYADEERLSSISRIFSGIAIFISCLGLYGLISFMAVQRTKEVGVRKVMGASVKDIVLLFYKEFVVLVIIAFAAAAPLTAYFMSDWLSTFAYRVDMSPWIFIVAITLSLIISLLTISAQSIKAALANPVDSLRSE